MTVLRVRFGLCGQIYAIFVAQPGGCCCLVAFSRPLWAVVGNAVHIYPVTSPEVPPFWVTSARRVHTHAPQPCACFFRSLWAISHKCGRSRGDLMAYGGRVTGFFGASKLAPCTKWMGSYPQNVWLIWTGFSHISRGSARRAAASARRRKGLPQGLKPRIFRSRSAEAKASAYLEATTTARLEATSTGSGEATTTACLEATPQLSRATRFGSGG